MRGDEFVAFMAHVGVEQRQLLENKVKQINSQLEVGENGVPRSTISVGIAHGSQASDPSEWFRMADAALYKTKRSGKCGFSFYGD